MTQDTSVRVDQMNDPVIFRKIGASKTALRPVSETVEDIYQLQRVLQNCVEIRREDGAAERTQLPKLTSLLHLQQRSKEEMRSVDVVAARRDMVSSWPVASAPYLIAPGIEHMSKQVPHEALASDNR